MLDRQGAILSKKMFCKSQLFAAAGLAGVGLVSCLIQPLLEVFNRWIHVKKQYGQDVKPPDRVNRLAKSAFEKMHIPVEISNKIDFFLTNNAESISLGSLLKSDSGNYKGYAFVGLPFFCAYDQVEDIPLEDLQFASPLFPFTMFSEQAKRRLDLMCISDSALEFLIAREVASLLSSCKLTECFQQSSSPSFYVKPTMGTFFPPRTLSHISRLSFVGSLYVAYQVCFGLNRLLGLCSVVSRSTRGLVYLGVTALLLLCQRQLLVAWRHSCALSLDAAIADCHSSLLDGGVEYYSWKREWNAFWTRNILLSARKAMSTLANVTRASLGEEGRQVSSPLKYQIQWALNESDSKYHYYIPSSVEQCFEKKAGLRLDDCNLSYLSAYRLPTYEVNTQKGDEKFASDGDVLRFNMAGLLAFGAVPKWLASIMQAFSFPATCGQRKAALERRKGKAL
ncbi:unnamed protein product [Hymenolepis diminuta]|uniref:DUF3395 domain-containing protein n=1 Tax=Hymenolepis diminuta TaxID=6216 RepID=A0A0R3S8F4_HYMDI|nr:unnamed protein product [Hymenolepis diminuta]